MSIREPPPNPISVNLLLASLFNKKAKSAFIYFTVPISPFLILAKDSWKEGLNLVQKASIKNLLNFLEALIICKASV